MLSEQINVSKISELINVSKTYRRYNHSHKALENVDFEVEKGDFIIMSGASGSGKSTLLALLGGFLTADEGEVRLMGKNVISMKDTELSSIHERHIGYVPQSNVMLPELTVLENITLPFYFKNRGEDQNHRAEKLLNVFGMEALGEKLPFELSGGELRRAAMIRALLNQPKFLIVDEPTAGLDANAADKIMEYLSYECEKNKTAIIVSTHDKSLVHCGNRNIRVEEGRVEE